MHINSEIEFWNKLSVISEILKELGKKDKPNLPIHTPADLVLSIAKIVEQSMGGSSGAVRH